MLQALVMVAACCCWWLQLAQCSSSVRVAMELPRARLQELCDANPVPISPEDERWGSVMCAPSVDSNPRHRRCRLRNLVLDRSKLEQIQPMNEYQPVGSKRDAFQIACSSQFHDFSQPFVDSHGLSSDGREFGQHFLHAVSDPSKLPQCDVVVTETTLMFNRDWYRNIWHRVANDLYPAFVALKQFGMENRTDLRFSCTQTNPMRPSQSSRRILHLDKARHSYEDLYGLVSSHMDWLDDWPRSARYVCFEDVFFMLSTHWQSTWPEYGPARIPMNAWAVEFGLWVTQRAQLGSLKAPFVTSQGRDITATWISRPTNVAGNRAMLNEDAVLERLQQRLDAQGVVVQKIDFDALSIRDQIAVARTSDILFGMHGAGLTHILWLPAHAVVLEVLPVDFDYRFYERVATASGLRYFHWQCDDAKRAVNCTWEPHKKFCNIVLPEEPILRLFERAVLELRGHA